MALLSLITGAIDTTPEVLLVFGLIPWLQANFVVGLGLLL